MGRTKKWASDSLKTRASQLRKELRVLHPEWTKEQIEIKVMNDLTVMQQKAIDAQKKKQEEEKDLQKKAEIERRAAEKLAAQARLEEIRNTPINVKPKSHHKPGERERAQAKKEIELEALGIKLPPKAPPLNITADADPTNPVEIDPQFKVILDHMRYANKVLGTDTIKLGEVVGFFKEKRALTPESKALALLPNEVVALLNGEADFIPDPSAVANPLNDAADIAEFPGGGELSPELKKKLAEDQGSES